jgi:hypothetical protein
MFALCLPWGVLSSGCTDGLPADVDGYADRCVRLNKLPIAEVPDDPHLGVKNVYVCNLAATDLLNGDGSTLLPYPEGTLIVKEARRANQDFVWQVATARKVGGSWGWDEYQRNFADQDFGRLPVSESVCIDCHRRVEVADWMFTPYTNRP